MERPGDTSPRLYSSMDDAGAQDHVFVPDVPSTGRVAATPLDTHASARPHTRVLLISCYELGHQPMGLALPLAILQENSRTVDALDLAVQELDEDRVRSADFVGISVPMHTALRIGAQVARRVRALNPDCHICFYGLYASLNAEYLLQECADSCIGGSFEEPLVALVRAVENGDRLDIPGVMLPGKPGVPALRRPPRIVPYRSLLPSLARYAKLERQGQQYTAGCTEASRGCLHRCRHCPIPSVYDGRFFVTPRELVLEDIRQQVAAGAAHITFGDPDFLNGPGHSLAVVEAMHEEFPDLTFDCTTKIEHILRRESLFPRLRDAGCLFIVSAVESLSDRVLEILDKGHTRADVERALQILDRAGIAMRPTWVAFTPWTERDDYLEVLQFVEDHGLIDHVDPVQYSIRLLIPPGSLLLDHPAMQPHLGSLEDASFSYTWSHPDAQMDVLQQEVSVLVESAAAEDEDPAATFYRIRGLAEASLTGRSSSRWQEILPGRPRAPRLTEPWFC